MNSRFFAALTACAITACADNASQLADSGVLPDANASPDAAVDPDAGAPEDAAPPPAMIALVSGSSGGLGNLDGPRRDARFSGPNGVARAADGTIYVVDASNYVIRKISPSGEVTTLAGSPGIPGSDDGTGDAARFELPVSVVFDPAGDLIVSDTVGGTLRRVTPAGVVTTYAGVAGEHATIDGPLAAARFRAPEGMAYDADGNLFVADREAHTIRRITPAGEVSTWVGTDLQNGFAEGPRETALIDSPFGIAVAAGGQLAIADSGNNVIRIVSTAGEVSTLAGMPGASQDTTDGTGSAARFGRPRALVFIGNGDLIVADTFNDRLRRVTPGGEVTTYAGTVAGIKDGPLLEAQLQFPCGLWVAEEDGAEVLYVADYGSSIVRRAAGGRIETFAGSAAELAQIDGPALDARWFGAHGILARAEGPVIVADAFNNAIRSIDASGMVETIAGKSDEPAAVDGPLATARFQTPHSFLDDGEGGYYVADSGNNRIRHVSAAGEVSTFAGGDSFRGNNFADGPRLDARFFAPASMVKDSHGAIYLTDAGNHAIRRIGPDGNVTTIAGDTRPGYVDGPGDTARFNGPDGLVLVDDQTLIVADAINAVLRKVVLRPDGTAVVSLFAGAMPENDLPKPGSSDGIGGAASFYTPRGLLLEGDAILVADTNNNLIRRVQLDDANVTTIAGTRGKLGIRPGPVPGTLFEPVGIARRPNGDLLISSFAALIAITGL